MTTKRDDLIERLRQSDGTTDVSVIFRRLREAADEIGVLREEARLSSIVIEELRRELAVMQCILRSGLAMWSDAHGYAVPTEELHPPPPHGNPK
jgi:hypothetical protein